MFGIDKLIGAVAGPLLGGLMGSQGSSQSTQQSIDPRMAKYIYGEDGKGGLLSEASKWYENNKTGLNSQMLQGLNTQWNVLNDPANMGAYTQMRNLGSGLMSAPVMGNPFSDGRASLSGNLGMSQMRPMQGAQTGGFDPRQSMGGAQGGLLGMAQRAAPQQYPTFLNPGANQAYTPQSPFVHPEWVSKPAETPAAKPVDPGEAERLRQQEEAAAMANRY